MGALRASRVQEGFDKDKLAIIRYQVLHEPGEAGLAALTDKLLKAGGF